VTALCALFPGVGCVVGGIVCALAVIAQSKLIEELVKAGHLECLQGCCPKNYVVPCEKLAVKNWPIQSLDDVEFVVVCIHFQWHALLVGGYGFWECITNCHLCKLESCCGEAFSTSSFAHFDHSYDASNTTTVQGFRGVIVNINNSPIPWSTGKFNATGFAMIPWNVMTGEVTLSAYDPRSGMFDDNVATVHVNDPFSEVKVVNIDFNPDTTVLRHNLFIGEFNVNSVNNLTPHHKYRFSILPSDTGIVLNIGMRSDNPLTFWLQDPSGNFIQRDSLTICEYVNEYVISESGTYVITVTYGVFGGSGPFAVGVNYAPYPSNPFLCGTIPYDTLYAGFDYIAKDLASVAPADTVVVEEGAIIQFEPGGIITASGVLQGNATPTYPIILTPAGGTNKKQAMLFREVKNESKDTEGQK
jgi:hypothetical protein